MCIRDRGYGHIEIALLPVITPQLVQIVVKLVVLEPARTRDPGEQPPFLGVHLFQEVGGFEVVVAGEGNAGDLDDR